MASTEGRYYHCTAFSCSGTVTLIKCVTELCAPVGSKTCYLNITNHRTCNHPGYRRWDNKGRRPRYRMQIS